MKIILNDLFFCNVGLDSTMVDQAFPDSLRFLFLRDAKNFVIVTVYRAVNFR